MNNNNFQMYQNSGYKNTRNRKRTLILDIEDNTALGTGSQFNIELFEPLLIDKQSEVYLDNVSTFNSNIAQTPDTGGFVLKINELNMNSNVASTNDGGKIFNSLIIPNEHKSVSNNHTVVIQKGKKFNYVCDINPQTIHSLSGKITDLGGAPMFHGSDTTGKFTYALGGIDSGKLDKFIKNGVTFAAITNVTSSSSGTFIATHFKNSTTLHFSTDTDIGAIADSASTHITFTTLAGHGASGTLQLTNATADNPNLHLINNPGRFTAEFSIISV